MADPEQIYQEVLKEEQAKGVTGVVAEARAKAARARAEAGSPHPKEPKWWPGAQPHLEGGEAEAPAEEAEAPVEEAEPEDAPAEEAEPEEAPAVQPAAEGPAEEAEPEEAPAEKPAAEAPAAQPAAEAPAVQPAAEAPAEEAEPEEAPAEKPAAEAPAAQPAAEAPAAQEAQPAAAAATATQERPGGVTHGTKTGTRLRPEDEVSTDSQFEGQKAVHQRRKLIDELVSTGVPAVSAADTGRPRAPWLAVLYLVIPLLVIAYLAGQQSESDGAEAAAVQESPAAPEEAGIVAEGTAFNIDTLELKAGEPKELPFENKDPTVHNLSIYEGEPGSGEALFKGPDVEPGASATYKIDPLKKGEYSFVCDYHTNMAGDVVVQ